jgi:hypothetical protein
MKNSYKGGLAVVYVAWSKSLFGVLSTIACTSRIRTHPFPHTIAPIGAQLSNPRTAAIKPKDSMDVIRQAMTASYHRTGVPAYEVSDRSLRADSAMAMLFGKIDIQSIHMMSQWHSDAMMRYLHVQAQPIIGVYAAKMFNKGTYTFQPDETVPIIEVCDV